jgi:uncharacterized membrane protein YgaE (UPF0421/DUF939 family)
MNLDGSFREYVSNPNPPFYVINLTAFVVGISVAIAVAFLFLAWQVEQVRRSSTKVMKRMWALQNIVYEYMKGQLSNILNKGGCSKIEEKGTTSHLDTGAREHHRGTTVAVVSEWVKRLMGLRSRRKPGDDEP